MTLFWHETGPRLAYAIGERTLIIEDLNPQTRLTWRMSRWEMIKLAVAILKVSLVM
jgi:hypothetical protein